tara:strand:- start:3224 stop:3949 length:726 start_codon:yes stop_codon:yes gene_type:complete
MSNLLFVGFVINFLLVLLFNKLPILTRAGWINAAILGTILWSSLGFNGWFVVVIYLFLGSLVTKVGFKTKKSLGINEKRDGRRGPENVWGSAATATFFAVLIGLNLGNGYLLKIGFAASIVAKLSDTFGSEIGKSFGKKTYLITTLARVKPGTEGGITLPGTLASFLGAALMAAIMYIFSFLISYNDFCLVVFAGFIATFFESFIGAKLQTNFKWNNEFVNCLLTSFSAILAIFFVIVCSN